MPRHRRHIDKERVPLRFFMLTIEGSIHTRQEDEAHCNLSGLTSSTQTCLRAPTLHLFSLSSVDLNRCVYSTGSITVMKLACELDV